MSICSVRMFVVLLRIKNIEGGSLEQRNEIFNDYLQSGVEVRYFDGKEERNEIVRLLDFNHPENNVFQVVNQWTFVEYSEKRPDIIIFINGMPLVIFELKSPSRVETDASDAYLQLRQYMKQIPSLFVPNVFCVMSDMTETRGRGSLRGMEVCRWGLFRNEERFVEDHA